jgi:D-tagatose-1,6-bisphosphate aldolase subunit GatZ/KbaZ
VHKHFGRILDAKKEKVALGICSVCSANRYVLHAEFKMAKSAGGPVLIESTSNQVDQFGGYTGMNPQQFVDYVYEIAAVLDFPRDQLILGGDHLGPNVWQNEKAKVAMAKARDQIHAYITAGYRKIHLDTSMHCADDSKDNSKPLDKSIIAERAADLCHVAEQAHNTINDKSYKPFYVIGSDVPIPGGAQEDLSHLQITSVDDVAQTIALTKEAFYARGLQDAWDRVIAVVVQPGVEFGDLTIVEYEREKAKALSEFIQSYENITYEAHSTDYQSDISLRQMVEDSFSILKVGPWLTFTFREAVFALAMMEKEWLDSRKGVELSDIINIIDDTMLQVPAYWRKHYSGDESQIRFLRKYSYSDRIRYFWPSKTIANALKRLIKNLEQYPIPLCLVSQYLPVQYNAIRRGELKNRPIELINDKINEVLKIYNWATTSNKN